MAEETMLPVPRQDPGAIIESASAAAAMAARAEIEAAYTVALRRPRDLHAVRTRALDACKRPGFAEAAMYRRPVGKTMLTDLSIRAAEELIRSMGNIRVDMITSYEDAARKKVRVTVTDLESNAGFSQEVSLEKTVERRNPTPDREVLGTRRNTSGATVSIVRATEEEMVAKEGARVSKVIRTLALRLVPGDITAEMKERLASGEDVEDPRATINRIVDTFHELGVTHKQLERALGKNVDSIRQPDIPGLRAMVVALREGAQISEYYPAEDAPPKPKRGRPKGSRNKPKPEPEPTPTPTPEPPAEPELADTEPTTAPAPQPTSEPMGPAPNPADPFQLEEDK